MPTSVQHDLLVDIFRDDPDLVSVLLRGLGVSIDGRARAVDAAFSAPVVGYQADAAFLVGGVLVVIEVQLRKDVRKHKSWPIYEATARARHPAACVLVLAPDAEVARWAAEPIALGPSGSICCPLVMGPAQLPGEPALRKHPGVATMAAIAHPSDPILAIEALTACNTLPEDKRKLYLDVILTALDDAVRKAVEMNSLDLSKYSPNDPFVKRYQRYLAMRRAEGFAAAIISVLEARGIRLTAAQHKRILACGDHATLERWIARAALAERAQDVFVAPPRPRASTRAKRPAPRPSR